MFTKKRIQLPFAFTTLLALTLFFFGCQKDNPSLGEVEVQPQNKTSLFEQALADDTQWIDAKDEGDGNYYVVGEEGTIISIDKALVDASGSQVKGDIQIQLVEIYTLDKVILNRVQTLAEVNGQPVPLESGGEVFVKVFQDGEELSVGVRGEMKILLPVANTNSENSADMELFYGEERGNQVFWQPTGQQVEIVTAGARNLEYYIIAVENTLGWMNVDLIYRETGEPIDCIDLVIECELCGEIDPGAVFVAVYVPAIPSAFEMPYVGNNTFQLCGDGGAPITLGGYTVTFIIAIQCGDEVLVKFVTTTLDGGYHTEVIDCEFTAMGVGEFQHQLEELVGC